jgi:hypothetical protein
LPRTEDSDTQCPRVATLIVTGPRVPALKAHTRAVTGGNLLLLTAACFYHSLLPEVKDYKNRQRPRITITGRTSHLLTVPICVEQKDPSQLIVNRVPVIISVSI